MNYPSINEYKEAILFAEDNFEQLKNLRPVLDEEGNPVMTGGNFAEVFKMKDEQTGKLHAVKCFLREQEGRAEAYRMIAEELEYVSSTFLTPIKYLDKELFVDTNAGEEKEYPILLMDWVEGETLDKYIRKHLDDQYELSLLAYQFSRLAMWLMPQPFAHGDLKPDNILVKSDGTLVLVDYDGMYVPAMKGQKARELGSPDFRHPSRTETDFDEHIDDFSLASILLSLKAISIQPSLLEEYGASDRLLFSEKDYRNISGSEALNALRPLMQDAELASLYSLFILAISQNNLSQVSFRLFNLNRPKEPELTDADLDAWAAAIEENMPHNENNCWPLLTFARQYGKMQVGEFVNKETGDVFKSCIFTKADGTRTFVAFSTKMGELTPKEIVAMKDNLIVVQDEDGNYSLSTLEEKFCEVVGIKHEDESLSTIVKKDDFKQSWMDILGYDDTGTYNYEEFGLVYSDDKKRLLSCSLQITHCSIRKETIVICDRAFSDKNVITVSIPNGVRQIGQESFYNCSGLKTISIPPSVENIGDSAFEGCYSLTEVKFNGIVKLGKDVFLRCKNLNKIHIPYGSKEIYGICLPDYKDKLVEQDDDEKLSTEVTDDDLANAWTDEYGVKYSADRMRLLRVEEKLTSYTIKNGTKVICDESFSWDFGNRYIKSVTIPNSVIRIGYGAFRCCEVLTQVTLSNSLTEIGERAFSGCVALKEIEIPNTVTQIGEGAFCGCESLYNTNIPNGINIIGSEVFSECGFSQITIPNSVKKIGCCAFKGCKRLTSITIPNSVIQIDWCAFYGCNSLAQVELPDSITEISDEVFAACDLSQINIPNSINRIGNRAFYSCGFSQFTIPNSVSIIDKEAFYMCGDLEQIIIPESVTIIRESVFADCYKLTKVILPNTIISIGDYAFQFCESLQQIAIPNSVSEIGIGVFDECDLSTIYIPLGTKKKFENLLPDLKDKLVEQENYYITDVTDDDYIGSLTDEYGVIYSEDGRSLLSAQDINTAEYSIKKGTQIICDHAFNSCTSLRSIEIPNSVNVIGEASFMYCHSLISVLIPGSVKTIKDCAFSGCTSLKTVSIQKGLTSIGGSAFSHCESLKVIYIPESVSFFGNLIDDGYTSWNGDKASAFDYCDSLESINIPKGTKEKFEKLLPEYKDKLLEQNNGWKEKERRSFSPEEIAAVARAEVVASQYGYSVCFHMNSGGQTYIPLSQNSSLTVGDTLDLKTAKLITLCREGDDDIYRVIE